jgi:hypothetical protein
MRRYLAKCPHTKTVKREFGNFVEEGNKSYFRVDKVITEAVPCGERNYVVVNDAPFAINSGIDPQGIEVKCKGCGQTYYLFTSPKTKPSAPTPGDKKV